MARNQSNSFEKEQHDLLSAHVENEIKKHSRVDTWDDFQPDKVSKAMLLDGVQSSTSYLIDEQSNRFLDFLSIATGFSSLKYAEKLLKVPELVENIRLLLQNMKVEVKEYAEMASEIENLIKCFAEMVECAQHNINMILPKLNRAVKQIAIIDDVISPQQNQNKLNDSDKNDIQLALSYMSRGMDELIKLANSARNQSLSIKDNISLTNNSVESKKITVSNRIDIVNLCLNSSIPVSGIAFSGTALGLVASAGYGGVGALTIAGVAFPPVTAIVCAALIGGACALTAVYLVKKFWARRQMKALDYLNKIFESLIQLNEANTTFLRHISDAKEKANVVKEHMQDIQLCLESERQRKFNQDACAKATESTKAMIDSLEKISRLDISQLTMTTCMALKSKK